MAFTSIPFQTSRVVSLAEKMLALYRVKQTRRGFSMELTTSVRPITAARAISWDTIPLRHGVSFIFTAVTSNGSFRAKYSSI
jgi:hypothetical protein